MQVYKLCRLLKSGEITPLFINKKQRLPLNEWLDAQCIPTDGFKVRPFWHCMLEPNAPHLSSKGRVWVKCEVSDYTILDRDTKYGGAWVLASRIRLLEIL